MNQEHVYEMFGILRQCKGITSINQILFFFGTNY
jgi:hypothetical protein